MRIDELRAMCLTADDVFLHLPPPNGQGYTRRLCGRRGPRGEVICGREGKGQTVRFCSKAVLKFLEKEQLSDGQP